MDIGTRFVKTAYYDGVSLHLGRLDTVHFFRELVAHSPDGFIVPLDRMGLSDENLAATGYGRDTTQVVGAKIISEITAHAAGARIQSGLANFTLVDLGGQDSKVILVKDGKVKDFVANDRCAASTGRYLENIAHILGLSVDELSRYRDDPEPLSAVCAVFGETELLSKLASGISVERLAAGANRAVIQRIRHPLKRLLSPPLLIAGGVAKNDAVRQALADETGLEPRLLKHPSHNGAIGAMALVSGALETELTSIFRD